MFENEAMRGIGVDGYRPFTAAQLGCRFHLPRGSEEETDQEVAEGVRIELDGDTTPGL